MEENRLKIIRDDLGGISQAKLAAKAGLSAYKLRDAESGKVKISHEIARIMEEKFGYSFRWVLTGQGEKFTESPQEGTPAALIYNKDMATHSREGPAGGELLAPGIKISEDLTLAARVLESNTPYAIALHLNIQSFARALDAGERITVLEANQHAMQLELKELRTELNRLKATYEAPDGGIGHHADTEKQAM